MHFSPFLSISHSCDEALLWTKKQLLQAGLRPVPTFDLQAARAGLHDCPCPNHGTNECDCQMVVLLVYDQAEDDSASFDTSPVTLILHGNDGQTWLAIADAPNQKSNSKTVTTIKNSLKGEGKLPTTSEL